MDSKWMDNECIQWSLIVHCVVLTQRDRKAGEGDGEIVSRTELPTSAGGAGLVVLVVMLVSTV